MSLLQYLSVDLSAGSQPSQVPHFIDPARSRDPRFHRTSFHSSWKRHSFPAVRQICLPLLAVRQTFGSLLVSPGAPPALLSSPGALQLRCFSSRSASFAFCLSLSAQRAFAVHVQPTTRSASVKAFTPCLCLKLFLAYFPREGLCPDHAPRLPQL